MPCTWINLNSELYFYQTMDIVLTCSSISAASSADKSLFINPVKTAAMSTAPCMYLTLSTHPILFVFKQIVPSDSMQPKLHDKYTHHQWLMDWIWYIFKASIWVTPIPTFFYCHSISLIQGFPGLLCECNERSYKQNMMQWLKLPEIELSFFFFLTLAYFSVVYSCISCCLAAVWYHFPLFWYHW